MLVIDEAKLPPPTPASSETANRVPNDTPGSSTIAIAMVGTSSSSAATMVQFRPPNTPTAKVYGIRSTAPTSVGSAVSRNFWAGSKPYSGPRKRTSTDQMLHTEKPMCSLSTEKIRLRRAMALPCVSQNRPSSGRQSSIQEDLLVRVEQSWSWVRPHGAERKISSSRTVTS